MSSSRQKSTIIEKELGIPADYQYKALRSRNIFQANWHRNKLTMLGRIVKPSMRILDLGTGSGNFEIAYSSQVKEIVGVDYNPDAVSFLNDKIKQLNINNVRVIRADIRKLQNRGISGKFDLIVIVDVIEHIREKEAIQVVGEIRKFLKPGGKVCVITPNYRSMWLLIENAFDKYGVVPHLKGEQHLAKYGRKNLETLFVKNGYNALELASFNLVSWLIPEKNISRIVCRGEMSSRIQFGNLLWGLFELK